MNTIKIIVGDNVLDGRCQTYQLLIETELSRKEIGTAFAIGVKYLGFDITEICKDYEDNTLALKEYEKIIGQWPDIPLQCQGNAMVLSEMDLYLTIDEFIEIYLRTVKLGNPNFEYVEKNPDYNNTLNIGGYGLFR